MDYKVFSNLNEMSKAAAANAVQTIKAAIDSEGEAHIILATGMSQIELLSTLVKETIDWSRVTAFHLDEYINLPITHPASFRKYLKERFVDKVPGIKAFHYIDVDAPDSLEECKRLGNLIDAVSIDLALVGIGENGHLAFNDPPADFESRDAFIVVDLDEQCRRQQLGEGWFPTLDAVPRQAISMSIPQIMKIKRIVCTVPNQRKAEAVKNTIEGEVSPSVPASILQQHSHCQVFLDKAAASLLK